MTNLIKSKTTLKINDWWGKKFASADNLFQCGKFGVLDMQKEISEFGSYYSFYKNDKLIAKFYQDHTFGFCTQPYGIELKNI
jgi:hypothetical protein